MEKPDRFLIAPLVGQPVQGCFLYEDKCFKKWRGGILELERRGKKVNKT